MKKRIIALSCLILCVLSSSTYAGWVANTCHSRANCAMNNESITWHYKQPHWWQVVSTHTKRGNFHAVDTGMNFTWRAAAIHTLEPPIESNPWFVEGFHFYQECQTCPRVYDWYTSASDCSIYDGWWDKSGIKNTDITGDSQ